MSAHLDDMLTESLRARAETGSPIEVSALLEASIARGRRTRSRRRVVVAAFAAVAVTVGLVVGTALPRRDAIDPVVASPSASPSPTPDPFRRPQADLALLPDAGVPGAATRPDLVGTDPDVLHFSIDAFARDAWITFFNSAPGVETARVSRTDLYLAMSLAQEERFLPQDMGEVGQADALSAPVGTEIGGRPATVRSTGTLEVLGGKNLYLFTWQPVDGLWARAEVHTGGQDTAVGYLAQVRLDQTRRCVTPFRAGTLPSGTAVRDRWVEFRADNPGGPFTSGGLTFHDGARRLRLQAQSGGGGTYAAPLTAGPYRVAAEPGGDSWLMRHGGIAFTATSQRRDAPVSQDMALQIIGGLQISDRLDDPGAW
jgi:hypothetical protein